MSIKIDKFDEYLDTNGLVAIVVKQPLGPIDEEDPVIFPPTYPMTTFKSRVHSIRDGDYRVSVELPPDSKHDKDEEKDDQRAGYNIDRFPDGTNSCEIDSAQSQANRIEPKFKTILNGTLVPQIEIQVGDDALNNKKVNLLDAGHRAADAVIRFSSLADKFHDAFLDAKKNNHFKLATIAPTSLLFGVWDSRSTYVKIQRIIKAHIRATNVQERTKSAQFTPAVDYVAAGAIEDGLDSGKGDRNPLSAEGMKHALATQTVGGVMLTQSSNLIRTVTVNLVALQGLSAANKDYTRPLQRYILGLALVAATSEPDLNLREGCNLRFKEEADSTKLVYRRGDPKPVSFDAKEIEEFAELAAREFFKLANKDFDNKDYRDAVFETGVAEEFLGMGDDRDKVRQLGPITAATLKKFNEQKRDPFKLISEQLKTAKKAVGKPPKKGQPPVKNPDAMNPLAEALKSMSENAGLPDDVKLLAGEWAKMVREHEDPHSTLKDIEAKLKDLKKSQKQHGTQPEILTHEAGA